MDPDTGEILACELTDQDQGDPSQVGALLDQVTGAIASVTADGAYDGDPVYQAVAERAPEADVIIPPRATAKPGAQANQAPRQRDRHIETIAQRGRLGWQRATGYGRRSLGETAMFRYKTVIGRRLRARSLPGQRVEARMGCVVINRMTQLGMPVSCRVA
jgi:transposase